MTRKVLIVTGDGGDSYEALYACQRFLEAHWEPVVAAPSRRRLHMVFHDSEPGWDTYVERPGHTVDAQMAITAVAAKEFAAIMILGGRAPEYLRNDASLLSLVREFSVQNKCICAIGHGIQVLVASGLTTGRTVTGHPHVAVEVVRAGGIFSDKPAVRDGRMITAQSWKAHPEFYRELLRLPGSPEMNAPLLTAGKRFRCMRTYISDRLLSLVGGRDWRYRRGVGGFPCRNLRSRNRLLPPAHRTASPRRTLAKRAYELYVLQGNESGSELDDWLQAEDELRDAEEELAKTR